MKKIPTLFARDFDGLAIWLHAHPFEGIVWHGGPDGEMAKIKKRDFPVPAGKD